MSDFERMVTKLRDNTRCAYVEGEHFEIWEWESGNKTIKMRPSSFTDDSISFDYDKDGNLTYIY